MRNVILFVNQIFPYLSDKIRDPMNNVFDVGGMFKTHTRYIFQTNISLCFKCE